MWIGMCIFICGKDYLNRLDRDSAVLVTAWTQSQFLKYPVGVGINSNVTNNMSAILTYINKDSFDSTDPKLVYNPSHILCLFVVPFVYRSTVAIWFFMITLNMGFFLIWHIAIDSYASNLVHKINSYK